MDIRIGKSSRHCFECEHSFEHEEPMHSIVLIEEQAFVRRDYCTACWRSEMAKDVYSAWECAFYDPEVAEQEPPESFSPLRQVFYETVESEERPLLAGAYLSAELLRRQKVFRLLKEKDDADAEVNVLLFSDRIGNRLIEVRDPNLTSAEMEEGRRILMERLNEIENPPEEADDETVDGESPEASASGAEESEVVAVDDETDAEAADAGEQEQEDGQAEEQCA